MTDIPAPDPHADALSSALPRLRSVKRTGWIIVLAIMAVALPVALLCFSAGKDGVAWGMITLFAGVFGAIITAGWVKKSHEREIMPIVAGTLNLSHEKSARYFFDTIPQNFVPRGGQRECDDLMSGRLADRNFRFAEIKTETGGKHSRTLFDGVVVEVSTRAALPEFLIAQATQTKGFWIFKGNVNVEDMARSHTAYGSDNKEYGLWSASSKPGEMKEMQALMDRLIALGPQLSHGSSLYSVACTGSTLLVALSHSHELFRIGGLFADEAAVMSDIRRATDELQVPMTLVAEVIRTEEAIHAAA